MNCPLGPPHLDGLRCAAEYGGVAEVLVEKLKYKGRVEFAPAMALAMAGAVAHGWPGLVFDAAVPVPLHGARQRQRGFNQAETLAQALAGAGGPPVWTGALKRIRPTPSQTRMGRRGRAANVRGAFAACGGGGELAGARLLLIDDVATTGATLSECARVLKAAGAATVHAAAYGRALNVARK